MVSPLEQSWLAEKQSALLYEALAVKEEHSVYGELFRKLKVAALEQAEVWEEQMRKAGEAVPTQVKTGLRINIILLLIKVLGVKPLRSILAATKVRGLSVYTQALPSHPLPHSVADIGRRHTGMGFGGNFRAAVFGINDGLVSNAALIFGMAGASAMDSHIIILAGIAGLFAGAFSMGAGEFLSVRSQKELFKYQIGLEAEELKLYPEEEAAELALIYEARGLTKSEAEALSNRIIANPEQALDTLAREELGLNPSELGSEYQAALFSFGAFSIGALIPLLPFFFGRGHTPFYFSIACTAAALFITGASLSLFTGKGALLSGTRMLLIGAAAAALTFFAGSLVGVSV